MDCPRCGGHVVVFELGDAVSRACEDCSYVGVLVDHRPDSTDSEEWDDAITRFRAQFPESDPDGVDRVDDDAAPPERADGDPAAESGGLRLVGSAHTATVDGAATLPEESDPGSEDADGEEVPDGEDDGGGSEGEAGADGVDQAGDDEEDDDGEETEAGGGDKDDDGEVTDDEDDDGEVTDDEDDDGEVTDDEDDGAEAGGGDDEEDDNGEMTDDEAEAGRGDEGAANDDTSDANDE